MAQDWHFHSGEVGGIPGWPACAPARTLLHVRALVSRPFDRNRIKLCRTSRGVRQFIQNHAEVVFEGR